MSRYAAAHKNPHGPGDARPTAMQIVKDEGMESKLHSKVIVITGTSSGLGIETARALAATGATLYLTARDLEKAKGALEGFFDPSRMKLVEMHLDSFDSVRAAAKTILSETNKVNILVNNAGVAHVPELQYTREGHELHFGTNHLAHFLLFHLLKPALLAASTPDFQSRVVSVASSAHTFSCLNASDNYNYEHGDYTHSAAYGQSKTANIYMASELERRYGGRGIHATSPHPGVILTPLARHLPAEDVTSLFNNEMGLKYAKSPEQGAATAVWAAIGKEWEGKGGKYLFDCAVAEGEADPQAWWKSGHAAHAYDPESEARLWNDSLKLIGVAADN